MNRTRMLLLAACLGFSLQGMSQQVLDKDVAGDREYVRVVREYELGAPDRLLQLENYLELYPDSRYANRVEAMMGVCYFEEGKYPECIAMLRSCDLELLPDEERDDCLMKLGTACLKTGNLKDASVWFALLEGVTRTHQADASYNLAYIDYAEKNYDQALEAFTALKSDAVYGKLVPYYIGEIHLLKKEYAQAAQIASDYLAQYAGHKDEAEMKRICGSAYYGLGNYMEAVPLLEAYQEAVSSSQLKALYDLGMSYYQTGAYSKAAETLGKVATTSDALSQNAYLHMGLSYLQLKERNQARMAFEQASIIDADPTVKEQALYNYALCIHETSYSPFAESVTVFERFLNEFPQSVYTEKVNNYLVEVYMNTRSYEAALKSIDKINRPGNRILEAKQKILFRMGVQSFANTEFREAIPYFNRSIEVGNFSPSTRADAYFWRGESHYRLENYQAATQDFLQYLRMTPSKESQEYSLALYNLGYTYFKQKKYAKALEYFNAYANGTFSKEKQMLADACNRIGDCQFYGRNFGEAVRYYAKAVETDPSLGDYSLYQEGFVKGLQRDYNGKIQTLNQLITKYPESQYIDEALYEQGRAFIQTEDNENAIERYRMLVGNFPESNMARKAASEIGLLYYQDDKYAEAITAYKNVIQKYPGSEEARVAQRDLKSIYIDLNRVDDYVDFASTIPGGINFDASERDSLTYVAAERVYLRGEMDEARNSFMRYLQTFPTGAFSLDANYYIGLIDYNQKATESAATHLDKVLDYPSNKYSEEAMSMRAEIAYQGKDYTRSLELYKLLRERASTSERRQLADAGMLRSAYLAGDEEETVLAASTVLSGAKVTPELETEARYYRAKAAQSIGRIKEASADWEVLAKDTRNVYGAEAKYLLAQNLFDEGKMNEAEQLVLEYMEVSTPHTYWLARSFVLLSDVYKAMGKNLDARQYLLSLKQNYQADDDIAGMIESRLEELKD